MKLEATSQPLTSRCFKWERRTRDPTTSSGIFEVILGRLESVTCVMVSTNRIDGDVAILDKREDCTGTMSRQRRTTDAEVKSSSTSCIISALPRTVMHPSSSGGATRSVSTCVPTRIEGAGVPTKLELVRSFLYFCYISAGPAGLTLKELWNLQTPR